MWPNPFGGAAPSGRATYGPFTASRRIAVLGAGLAIVAALKVLPVSAASTASVHVPATIAGHSEVHVTGVVLCS